MVEHAKCGRINMRDGVWKLLGRRRLEWLGGNENGAKILFPRLLYAICQPLHIVQKTDVFSHAFVYSSSEVVSLKPYTWRVPCSISNI